MEKILGLTSNQAKTQLLQFGPNTIVTKEATSALQIFISQFPNVVNGILVFAAVISFLLKDLLDGIFILAILFLNALFGFLQEFRAEKAIEALKKFVVDQARVLRDGKERLIAVSEIVPGDLVVLSEGDKIPADGVLIEGSHVEVDESLLTGESIPVLKTDDGGKELFLGTTIVRGHGKLLVEQTGNNTRFGEIAKTLSSIQEGKTPLHVGMDRLGKQLAFGIVTIGILIVFIGFLQGREFFSILLTSISIAVAGIPEGLPAVITIALALGMQRMAKKRSIVRKMAAIETLGATQIILTDKTGTLTQNEMRVKKLWHEGSQESFDVLLKACILGNTASLVEKFEGGKDFSAKGGPASDWDVVGDKTDGALLLFAKKHRQDLDIFKNEGEVVDEYVFDPATKTITVVWRKDKGNKGELVLVRGQPEGILAKSKYVVVGSKKQALTPEISLKIKTRFEDFAKEGLRIIGFGFREVSEGKSLDRKQLEEELVFLGFVGIYDPPRKEAQEAVRLAKEAGIRTVMVTGDNKITALAIAREVGLVEKDEDVVLGDQLAKLSDDEVLKILPKTRIFARVTPIDKLRLVSLFKRQGYIVGVTGDGVNDALALKKADVGVAMGLSGTDVAKEASDIIITDDNFASLILAIEEGRTIYDNIVKAITFLLSANLAEVATIFFAIALGLPAPLLPTQILWMNLVTDGLPALALASDTKDPDVLKRLPRNPKQHILSTNVLRVTLIAGTIMTLITLISFFIALQLFGEGLARALAFNLIIGLQMFFIFFIRGGKNPFSNRFLLISIAIPIFLQILIMVNPILREIFHISL